MTTPGLVTSAPTCVLSRPSIRAPLQRQKAPCRLTNADRRMLADGRHSYLYFVRMPANLCRRCCYCVSCSSRPAALPPTISGCFQNDNEVRIPPVMVLLIAEAQHPFNSSVLGAR